MDEHSLKAAKRGSRARRVPADTAPVTLLLQRLTELPAVVTRDTARHFISGNRNGFAERARLKLTGYFITDTLLRESENRTLANLIRSQFPGGKG